MPYTLQYEAKPHCGAAQGPRIRKSSLKKFFFKFQCLQKKIESTKTVMAKEPTDAAVLLN